MIGRDYSHVKTHRKSGVTTGLYSLCLVLLLLLLALEALAGLLGRLKERRPLSEAVRDDAAVVGTLETQSQV